MPSHLPYFTRHGTQVAKGIAKLVRQILEMCYVMQYPHTPRYLKVEGVLVRSMHTSVPLILLFVKSVKMRVLVTTRHFSII